MNELREILRHDRRELLNAFDKARVSGKGTPEHVANDREAAFREVLGRYFPYQGWKTYETLNAELRNIDRVVGGAGANPGNGAKKDLIRPFSNTR